MQPRAARGGRILAPHGAIMVIAQALGEYAALGVLVEAFNTTYYQVRDAIGDWGLRGLVGVIAVGLVWKLITMVR